MMNFSDISTKDLVKELKMRKDVVFVACYTREQVKERVEIAANDNGISLDDGGVEELTDKCLETIDRDYLKKVFTDWENDEGSTFDRLVDEVNSVVIN